MAKVRSSGSLPRLKYYPGSDELKGKIFNEIRKLRLAKYTGLQNLLNLNPFIMGRFIV
jgi:hypothetical protein